MQVVACIASPARLPAVAAAWFSARKLATSAAAAEAGNNRRRRARKNPKANKLLKTEKQQQQQAQQTPLRPTEPGAETVVVVGGGAAGYFAAIRCKELAGDAANVVLLERGAAPLRKVAISGGGRCNFTHDCHDIDILQASYPRGGPELRQHAFEKWPPLSTIEWFSIRGVQHKVEADGRIFPDTDDSGTIVSVLEEEAADVGVQVITRAKVSAIHPPKPANTSTPSTSNASSSDSSSPADGGNQKWKLQLGKPLPGGEQQLEADKVLIATGSDARLWQALEGKLDHKVVPAVPSLFTFKCKDSLIEGLAGVVASSARVSADIYPGQPASALASTAPPSAAAAAAAAPSPPMDIQGPVLITHAGLSGPAVLKLSAFAARAMHAVQHKFVLTINFAGMDAEVLARLFREAAQLPGNRRKTVASHTPPRLSALIPKRLYKRLCHRALGAAASGTDSGSKGRNGRAAVTWGDITDANIEALIATFTSAEVNVDGKATYKDEFVTAGGVALENVDLKTFESKISPGLFFAGEVLDVDGVTGGFNFQAAWATGWLAGEAMARPSNGPEEE